MAKKAAARTSRINRAPPAPAADLERYCRGLNDWPRSWLGWEKDVPPGEELVACFRPFLEYLVKCADLSPKTIQKHVDNLWALGGEIIRALNEGNARSPVESSDTRVTHSTTPFSAWQLRAGAAPMLPIL